MFEKEVAITGRPETEIENAMTRANNAASRLHTRLDALFDRLRPVIVPVGAETASGSNSGGAPKAVMSPLGDGIRDIEKQIDGACDRMESLLRDLAL